MSRWTISVLICFFIVAQPPHWGPDGHDDPFSFLLSKTFLIILFEGDARGIFFVECSIHSISIGTSAMCFFFPLG